MPPPSLIVHGGAGALLLDGPAAADRQAGCRRAIETAWAILTAGGGSLDAVCAAVEVLEDDPCFNAGLGSVLTAAGCVEMDASVMDGHSLAAGAAAVLRTIRNPVRLARAILDDGRHVMLAGDGAEAFADLYGIPRCAPKDLVTAAQILRWRQQAPSDPAGTVGAVAVDRAGHVAAATSTGGLAGKLPGRIGDSAIIGAGTYADDAGAAVSATGHGESILRVTLARLVADLCRGGVDPMEAAAQGLRALGDRVNGTGGLIVVDTAGRLGIAHNTAQMTVASMTAGLDAPVVRS